MRDKETLVRIMLHFKGSDQSMRKWPAVPRVGEEVVVMCSDGLRNLKVKRVVWGTTEESRSGLWGDCEVTVVLENPPTPQEGNDNG